MRYETCNPGQDADCVEAGPTKETNGSSPLDAGVPGTYDRGVGNGVTGDINGTGRATNGHHRNTSEATAVSPGAADTIDGLHRNDGGLSPTGHGDYQSATNAAAGQYGNASVNQAPGTYTNQTTANPRNSLNPVHERGESGHINQF